MIDFVNPEMLATAQLGNTQLSVAQHERVARHYEISSIDLPAELADRIAAGSMTWETFGGTHPGPLGNQMAADLVAEVLSAGWNVAAASAEPAGAHPEPAEPLIATCFNHGKFVPAESIRPGDGWHHEIPEWKSIAGSQRERFAGKAIFHCTQPESTLSFQFSGQAVGAYVLAGPDAGQLEVQIDDGSWNTVELYHAYSGGLHYPRTVMFATGLSAGNHEVKVRLAKTHPEKSKGTAARILNFAVSE